MNNNIKLASELVRIASRLVAGHVFCDDREYRNIREVKAEYPSAAKIVKVTGGWAVFDTLADYETWKRQK